MFHWKIGVIDLEVYHNFLLDTNKVYFAGLYSYVNSSPVIIYIDKDLNSDKIVFLLIDEMFKVH